MNYAAFVRVTAAATLAARLAFGANAGLQSGKADLKSTGPMAFGPNGILFVGDSANASVMALDTADNKAAASPGQVDIKALNEKIASALGTAADQILINDVAVNPVSKRVYISVTRGRGPEAVPVILRTGANGALTELALDKIGHAAVTIPDAPAPSAKDGRGQSKRLETITDLAFVDGRIFVAGLSNEEFSSTLRAIAWPFQSADKGAGIEIFHGAHGRFETNAPVRTFVPYEIAGKPHILAAYTCTPLVTIPVSELRAGNKVKGTTIAELGNRNRPLDMIVYRKDGKDFILMANSSRGVMKLPAQKLDGYEGITAQTEKQGVPYETIASLKGVQQLDKFDDKTAILLTDASGSLDLQTIALP